MTLPKILRDKQLDGLFQAYQSAAMADDDYVIEDDELFRADNIEVLGIPSIDWDKDELIGCVIAGVDNTPGLFLKLVEKAMERSCDIYIIWGELDEQSYGNALYWAAPKDEIASKLQMSRVLTK